jgi:hypothetical protein
MKTNISFLCLFCISIIVMQSCSFDPTNKFKGKYFDTVSVTVFNQTAKQIISFSSNIDNKVTTFNTSSGETSGTWEYVDEEKRKIRMTFPSGGSPDLSWRSGIWEFNEDYTWITHLDRDETYYLRN